jgi:hypothetical protein
MDEVILMHPMKTGGRTLIIKLRQHEMLYADGMLGHSTLKEVVRQVGGYDSFVSHRSLMVARNPYSRLASFHRFCSRLPKSHAYEYCLTSFEEFVLDNADFLTHLCIPQHEYCMFEGKCLVDHIARFEDFGPELTWFFKGVGINEAIKTDNFRDWKDKYTPETQRIVYEAFEQDFDLLDYDYPIDEEESTVSTKRSLPNIEEELKLLYPRKKWFFWND